jgi:hypothetical protein
MRRINQMLDDRGHKIEITAGADGWTVQVKPRKEPTTIPETYFHRQCLSLETTRSGS